jgi:hypothetical protein
MNAMKKMRWVVGLGLIFLLVLATNSIDKGNYNKIKSSLVSIYDNRLVAIELLYRMNDKLSEYHLAMHKQYASGMETPVSLPITDLNILMDQYAQTFLTSAEEKKFEQLREEIARLEDMQTGLMNGSTTLSEVSRELEEISKVFDSLLEIQMREGKSQMAISQQAMDVIDLFSNIEMVVLVVLALLIQFVIIYKSREKS